MTHESENDLRTAHVNRTGDGRPLGIALFISAPELRELNVEPDAADRIAYAVVNGELRLLLPNRAREQRGTQNMEPERGRAGPEGQE